MRKVLALALLVATLGAAACSHGAPATSPRPASLPRMDAFDSPLIRAGKLAGYMQRRWPRVGIDQAEADEKGTVVQFEDHAKFDYSIKDPDAYEANVKLATADLAQASVELLKLSLRYFPHLQYASVWQDSQLKAYWSREGIVALGSAQQYRTYKSFLRLVMTAQFPPLGIEPPPAPTS